MHCVVCAYVVACAVVKTVHRDAEKLSSIPNNWSARTGFKPIRVHKADTFHRLGEVMGKLREYRDHCACVAYRPPSHCTTAMTSRMATRKR
jgi:hypothetical protein